MTTRNVTYSRLSLLGISFVFAIATSSSLVRSSKNRQITAAAQVAQLENDIAEVQILKKRSSRLSAELAAGSDAWASRNAYGILLEGLLRRRLCRARSDPIVAAVSRAGKAPKARVHKADLRSHGQRRAVSSDRLHAELPAAASHTIKKININGPASQGQ
jgi:hypothetical protein